MTAAAPQEGGRGGEWVLVQFVLMAAIVIAGVVAAPWPGPARSVLGALAAVVALGGVTVAVWSARALGRSLTPFPRPVEQGELVQSGPYRLVRHPIYSGGLVFFVGFSLWGGPLAMALVGVLALLWALKARVEERHLLATYPAYAGYVQRVRWRIVPYVY